MKIADLLGEATEYLSRSTVQRVMKELIERGYLERVGSKKSGSWVVKDSKKYDIYSMEMLITGGTICSIK